MFPLEKLILLTFLNFAHNLFFGPYRISIRVERRNYLRPLCGKAIRKNFPKGSLENLRTLP